MVDFVREAFVQLGGAAVSGLRVSFRVVATPTSDVDQSVVVVYNLTNERVSNIRQGDEVRVDAGYRGVAPSTVVVGHVQSQLTRREGADRLTLIELANRDLLEHDVSQSFSGRERVSDLVSHLLMSAGLSFDVDRLLDLLPDAVVENAIVSGSIGDALSGLLGPHGIAASMNGGLVEFHAEGVAEGDVLHISESSGLVGAPELTDAGVRLRVVLEPRVRPQQRISVHSVLVPDAVGEFRVVRIEHRGDTGESDEWYTELEARA